MQLTPAREGVESFVIDSERSYLFALRTHSEIEAFSFANDRFEQIAKYSQPRNQPKIVSIAVIGKHESQTKSLVAITATGASPTPLPPSPPWKLTTDAQVCDTSFLYTQAGFLPNTSSSLETLPLAI
jgi:hypothetical protein